MAKTISQSVDSLETSESSLESSLSKCRTSISNKGVTVPSTTRFSGLPAKIDEIKTGLTRARVESTSASEIRVMRVIGGQVYSTDDSKIGSNYYYFDDVVFDGNQYIRYFEPGVSSGDYLEVRFSAVQVLRPHSYTVFVDNPSLVSSVILLSKSKGFTVKEFNLTLVTGISDRCWAASHFGNLAGYVRVKFTSSFTGKKTVDIPIWTGRESGHSFIDINTATKTWAVIYNTYNGNTSFGGKSGTL